MSALPHLPDAASFRPHRRLALAGLVLSPGLAGMIWWLAPGGLVLGSLGYLAGLGVAVRGMAADYPHDGIGACNLVTTLRLGLVAAIAALGWAEGAADWSVLALAVLALALDGVDGALARRHGFCSTFGARYDVEVDAALAAVLATLLLLADRAGGELLVLGFARYAFLLASLALPWLRAPLAESRARKAVCVVQIGTLAALTAPILPEAAAGPLALGAAALLLWSFGRDILRLARRR
jgi:phosphatidylglycerophosphate synthase